MALKKGGGIGFLYCWLC